MARAWAVVEAGVTDKIQCCSADIFPFERRRKYVRCLDKECERAL